MAKIQLSSGASSCNTHHLTQSSQAIDRRNVVRPSNLAIEEAARAAQTHATDTTSSRPSRLVNLHVHAADLAQIEATEAPAPQEEAPVEQPTIVPNVIELGAIDRTQSQDLPTIDLTKLVPEEAPVEETTSYAPTTINSSVVLPEAPMVVASEVAVITTTPIDTAPTIDSQDLAMSIAADYAAASIDATELSNTSIDTIAQATSEAITAIRSATDPEEIAEQVASLKSFADNLKTNSSAPEMVELSNTIDKFISIAMKSTKVQEEVQKKIEQKAAVKPTVKKSSAAKPSTSSTSRTAKNTTKAAIKQPTISKTVSKPASRTATKPVVRPAARRTVKPAPKLVADEDRALRTALRNVAAMDGETESQSPKRRPVVKKRGAGKRLVLAFFCAVACVAGIVYFVGSNIPDISVKVAAIQTGIEASYPSYIPRDYSLSDINSENGKITMTFKGPEKAAFTLTEEKSSWDSTALLRNYVEPTWQNNYITTHEQGITIYISGANAAWVNGGVLYKINDSTSSLTKKQLRNIVTSM